MLKRLLFTCVGLCFIPVAAWAFYKPTRVLAPELAGVACVSEVICRYCPVLNSCIAV